MKFNGRKLSEEDAQSILHELKNPQVSREQKEMFKKAREVYLKSKEIESFRELAKEKARLDATVKDAIYMDKMKSIKKMKEYGLRDEEIADILNLEEDIYKELLLLIEERSNENDR